MDNAVKIARAATGRQGIIAFDVSGGWLRVGLVVTRSAGHLITGPLELVYRDPFRRAAASPCADLPVCVQAGVTDDRSTGDSTHPWFTGRRFTGGGTNGCRLTGLWFTGRRLTGCRLTGCPFIKCWVTGRRFTGRSPAHRVARLIISDGHWLQTTGLCGAPHVTGCGLTHCLHTPSPAQGGFHGRTIGAMALTSSKVSLCSGSVALVPAASVQAAAHSLQVQPAPATDWQPAVV